mgnify:CR=1 FL=1
MTWAYAENSTHSDFPRYDRDQMTMYNRIVAATNAKIDTNDRIFGVIPAGTAVQNARTSYIGDNLTADGYHLNENGEFIAGLTWIHKITGFDLDRMDETLIPAQFLDRLDIYKESVENAVADPYRITQSQYTEAPVVATFPVIDFEEIKDGMQYRNQPVTNWTDATEDNLTEIDGNKAFVFKPMASNLYGFRQNFAEGTLSSALNTVSFDLRVDAGNEGNYVVKMWMYYGTGASKEITPVGTGVTVNIDSTFKTTTLTFDYSALGIDIDSVAGYSIQTLANANTIYMDNVRFNKGESSDGIGIVDFDDLTGMQFRKQPDINWTDMSDDVVAQQNNIVTAEGNKVFAFRPVTGTNLYGFRHNFQAGAFSGCTSLKFDLAVADSAAAGEYTYKIFLYYGNANTEITSGGGSAYDIGNDAIRAACRAESGIGPDTMLKKLFLEELKTETVTENLAYFYSVSKIGIASYALLVFKAFKAGDRVAAEILKDNMRNVAELMVAGRKKSDTAAPVFVVIAGGLTAESEILLPFIEENIALTDNPDNFEISVFRGDAVCGALMLAGLGSVKEES